MNPPRLIDRLRAWLTGLPQLLLLLMLAATYWLNQQVQPLPLTPDSSKRHEPDFIVSEVVATTLNEQGKPRFVMAAKKCCITRMIIVRIWKPLYLPALIQTILPCILMQIVEWSQVRAKKYFYTTT